LLVDDRLLTERQAIAVAARLMQTNQRECFDLVGLADRLDGGDLPFSLPRRVTAACQTEPRRHPLLRAVTQPLSPQWHLHRRHSTTSAQDAVADQPFDALRRLHAKGLVEIAHARGVRRGEITPRLVLATVQHGHREPERDAARRPFLL
jgi:hypothetical protein